jgi:hypothetical protein
MNSSRDSDGLWYAAVVSGASDALGEIIAQALDKSPARRQRSAFSGLLSSSSSSVKLFGDEWDEDLVESAFLYISAAVRCQEK